MPDTRLRPAVVVVAYNRPEALARLLRSVERADYPVGAAVPLVVSIDKSGSDAVREVAEAFRWAHGPKEVIAHGERLGLREHILRCGDLTAVYGSIIMLEDDLYVSRRFYDYAAQAIDYYAADDRIAGVSLYTHHVNFLSREPFVPLADGADVFFLQVASSWGQAWTRRQWAQFRSWYGAGRDVTERDPLPGAVVAWPDSSWLKRFICYMVETERQFVYPRVSLTTNFGDAGAHVAAGTRFWQVPLRIDERPFRFVPLDDSHCVYDAYFELSRTRLDRLTDRLRGYDYAVDLYGLKRLETVPAPYLLTGRAASDPVCGFADQLTPPVLNVIEGLPGDAFVLCRREDARGEGRATAIHKGSYEDFAGRFSAKQGLWFGLRKAARKVLG